MRGSDSFTEGLFSMRRLDDFVAANHPLCRIRVMVNEALVKMDGLFSARDQVPCFLSIKHSEIGWTRMRISETVVS